ncbi:oxygen-independent coproporphyrinogen III oxidase [Olivibacter sp. SDN3]|uniref:oxygen-independent coproporphyrinogen III oxidase n=1 Tax=Olivibacter sp. SDN3 TaxID=2764720 RepID=UPI0016516DF6|nr:oxygen-independent coproporphyrinogen III oxidase [Olivibacter sp. SDN3]QNL48691.1 oxygen-independent coproporphyrinogen III oxidase [Olivibacter sp. SDN3]
MNNPSHLDLLLKYNVAAPRYTSYPTVPHWDKDQWSEEIWLDKFAQAAQKSKSDGISLYIHLPFCESLCTYCGCNTRITRNHGVEQPYVEAVLKEWQYYKSYFEYKPRIHDIHLGGGTPTFFSPENLARLLSAILEDTETLAGAEFSFEAHPANTSSDHLETLYDLGFRRLSLGIQDFDPKVQKIINRQQNPADVIRVIQQAHKLGYTSINFDLIYGLPLQTLQGIKETINLALAMRPDRIAYYSYAHVPWLKPGQRMFTESDLPTEQEKFGFYITGKEMIKNAGYRDIGMDHFALPGDKLSIAASAGKLNRNFMGYTDIKTSLLVGLGVSAISDTGDAFAQNIKNVEDYKQYIDDGKLPLLKGHVHSNTDLMVKEQIHSMMCERKLNIMNTVLSLPTLKRIQPLVTDGLLSLENDDLVVTPIGKSFLRNICMAFDERLDMLGGNSDKQTFSKAI